MLFASREVRIGKNCARGLKPRAVLKTEGIVFPKTHRPRLANNVLLFSVGYYFLRNICVDFFTEAVSHCARAFDVS